MRFFASSESSRGLVRVDETPGGPVIAIPTGRSIVSSLVELAGHSLLACFGIAMALVALDAFSRVDPISWLPLVFILTLFSATAYLIFRDVAILRGAEREVIECVGKTLRVRWRPTPLPRGWSIPLESITAVRAHGVDAARASKPAEAEARKLVVSATTDRMQPPEPRRSTGAFWRSQMAGGGVVVVTREGRRSLIAENLDEGQILYLLELLRDRFHLPVEMPKA